MRAGAILFRLRMAIILAIVALGFWAPWIKFLSLGRRTTLLESLALELGRSGLISFTVATPLLIVLAALLALLAAVLRIWGTAWLGPAAVYSGSMQGGEVLADGPYRFVRNPLYLGTWFLIVSIAFIMPASGALVSVALVTAFLLILIRAEEAYLADRLGEAYRAYQRAVPRLLLRLRTTVRPSGRKPHWRSAVLAELSPVAVVAAFGVMLWSYDRPLMVRTILIGFGISLVARAFALKPQPEISQQG